MSAGIPQSGTAFVPAWVRIQKPPSGQTTVHPDLGVRFRDNSVLVPSDEHELGHWAAVAACMVSVSQSGAPIDVAAGVTTGRMVKLFWGAADVMLTDRRIVALVTKGESPLGDLGDRSGAVLVLSFPLHEVESVSIDLKKKMFGGVKEGPLHVMRVDNGPAALVLEDIVAAAAPGKDYVRFTGTKRDILESTVAPVVAAHREHTGDRPVLAAAAGGERLQSPTEIAVQFSD